MWLTGLDQPIGATDNHPFWSEDRQQFVEAGHLLPQERVRTRAAGVVRVASVLPRPGPERVYNLEVHGQHVYEVSNLGVLVHNSYSITGPLKITPTKLTSYFSAAGKYGVLSYGKLKIAKAGTNLQAHHLIEGRFAGLFGVNKNAMSSIALTADEHQAFTNAWRHAIPHGTDASKAQVVRAAQRIYQDYPALLRAMGM